ncbi:hypothetical protein GCM10027517_06110 [Phycicoccus ginsengisoli]
MREDAQDDADDRTADHWNQRAESGGEQTDGRGQAEARQYGEGAAPSRPGAG